jgi:hypothetical protein
MPRLKTLTSRMGQEPARTSGDFHGRAMRGTGYHLEGVPDAGIIYGCLPFWTLSMKPSNRGVNCFLLAATAIGLPVLGADKPVSEQHLYANAAEDCALAIESKKRELAGEYSSEVWSLKQRFQTDGDLEKALAVDREWSRSLNRKPPTSENVVDFPPELTKLQKEFLARFEKIAEVAATEFLDGLRKEASELAKAGKLDAGRVLQQEIDEIKTQYLSGKQGETANGSNAEGKTKDPVSACEEAIRQGRIALQNQYVGELESLEKSFQAQGALEDLLAVKNELKRYKEVPELTQKHLVDQPEPLRAIQEKYIDLQRSSPAQIVQEWIDRLESEKKLLTIDGKLSEAVEKGKAIEKLQKGFGQARRAPTTRAKDKLGDTCIFRHGDWQGLWKRRPGTDIFDCEMRHGPAGCTATYTATLTYDGKDVSVSRTNSFHSQTGREPDRQYVGRLSGDGRRIDGDFGTVEAAR